MKTDNVFVGDIRVCTKCIDHVVMEVSNKKAGYVEIDDELHQENAVLVKTTSGKYVELHKLYLFNGLLDFLPKAKLLSFSNMIMSIAPERAGELFVDEKSLKPYQPIHEFQQPAKTLRLR